MDVGIIGYHFTEKQKLIQLLEFYLFNGHVTSQQKKSPYILIPSEYRRRLRISESQITPSKTNLNSGIFIFQNPESNLITRMFIQEPPEIKIRNNPQNFISNNETGLLEACPNFFDYGNLAVICDEIITVISAIHPIDQQLKPLLLMNSKNKKIHIFITNIIENNKNHEDSALHEIDKQINKFSNRFNLNLKSITPFSPKKIEFSYENSQFVEKFFKILNEPINLNIKQKKEHIIRVMALHGEGCGSTTFFNSFKHDAIQSSLPASPSLHNTDETKPTRGIEFHVVKRQAKDYSFVFQIFDLAGHSRWRFLADNFIKYSKIFLLLYDLSEENSTQSIQYWIQRLEKEYPNNPIIIIGTKKDLQTNKKNIEGNEWLADQRQIKGFLKTSAITGEGMGELIPLLLNLTTNKYHLNINDGMDSWNNQVPKMLHLDINPLTEAFHEANNIIHSQQTHSQELIQRYFTFLVEKYHRQIPSFLQENFHSFANIEDKRIIGALTFSMLKNVTENFMIEELIIKFQNEDEYLQYLMLDYFSHLFRTQYNQEEEKLLEEQDLRNKLESFIIQNIYQMVDSSQNRFSEPVRIKLLQLIRYISNKPDFIELILIENLVDDSEIIQNYSFQLLRELNSSFQIYRSKNEILANLNQREASQLISKLVNTLKSSNNSIVKEAIRNLAILPTSNLEEKISPLFLRGDHEINTEISKALHRTNPSKYSTAIYPDILGYIPDSLRKKLVNLADKFLVAQDYERRLASIKFLQALKEPTTIKTLLIALNDPKESIRLIAVESLLNFENQNVTVPLIYCYINSESEVINNVILEGLTIREPNRFKNREISDVIKNLNSYESEELLELILNRLKRAKLDTKKINLIEILQNFKAIQVINILIGFFKDSSLRVQQSARRSLKEILGNMNEIEISRPAVINALLRSFEENFLFIRFELDLNFYLSQISWIEIIKGILYQKLTYSTSLVNFINQWQEIDLELLYKIAKYDTPTIISTFIQNIPYSTKQFNTFQSYFQLNYPNSYELVSIRLQHRDSLTIAQEENLERLAQAICLGHSISVKNDNIDHHILL